jgi:hypothetical protein
VHTRSRSEEALVGGDQTQFYFTWEGSKGEAGGGGSVEWRDKVR